MRLTAKERILLHLLDAPHNPDDPEVSALLAQEGVARGAGIELRHLAQFIRPLVQEGLVRERMAHVVGIRQRRKVYGLTELGRRSAKRIEKTVRGEAVQVRDASGSHQVAVHQVLEEAGGSRSLLEVVRQVMETGAVDLSVPTPVSGTATVGAHGALDLEKAFDWLGAATVYETTIASTGKGDFHTRGSLFECLGNARYRAAMQAANPEEFRERVADALEACGKAKDAYEASGGAGREGRALRCHATMAYLRFWLADAFDERKKHLDDAWEATNAALEAIEAEGDLWEYGTTFNRLALVSVMKYHAEWDVATQQGLLRGSIELGERAIRALSPYGDRRELAEAYARTAANLNQLTVRLASLEEREGLYRKTREYFEKARGLSEETAMLLPFHPVIFQGTGTDETLQYVDKALECARRTKDRLVIGLVLRLRAYHKLWKSLVTEDMDEWKGILKSGLEDAENAKEEFAAIAFNDVTMGFFTAESARGEYYYELSKRETDPRTRRELLRMSLEAGRDAIRKTERFGFPEPFLNAHSPCIDSLTALGEMEEDPETKRRLLQEALDLTDKVDWMLQQRCPSTWYNRGDSKMARARLKAGLAPLVESPGDRIRLLQEAVRDDEEGVSLCNRDSSFYEASDGVPRGEASSFVYAAPYQLMGADMCVSLYELTGDPTYLRTGAAMAEGAADAFRRADLPSRVAECHWKSGRIQDSLEDHASSAQEFSRASVTYKAASARVPQLQDFYEDLALYMQAWNEIEKARHHHAREEYNSAKDYYERAATLHEFSKRWRFMAPNYAAWSLLEGAEDLSRREASAEAMTAFEGAGTLFREARTSLESALGRTPEPDERKMITALIVATGRRWQYCAARIALEEAKVLYKKGEHASSSQRYGQAADGFERLAADATSDADRRDLGLIATLAKAWEAMAEAEADASPELYAEAARFFESARQLSPSEKTKALALGHSHFCRALEAGTMFADTRDPAFYASAIQHLDNAASHYAKIGVENTSHYAQASRLLLEAYAAMDRAGREQDPETKVKAYLAVETILAASAAAFGSADHSGKRDQTLRLLENVKRERELAVSLTEVFRAPLSVSSTTSFASPAPSFEQAVGGEEFEHAAIRARLIPGQKDHSVGGRLELTIELVNAGRAAGQLIKVEKLVPRDFQLLSKPAPYELEEDSLNLRGRRLEPLKTEQVRVVLRPMATGVFALRPRIMYLDELGNYLLHEPEPVEVRVVD